MNCFRLRIQLSIATLFAMCVYASFGAPTKVLAQIGATKQTLTAFGQLELDFKLGSYRGRSAPNWPEHLKLEPAVFTSRVDGNIYYIGFKDGKVALVDVPKRPDERRQVVGVPNSVLIDCIARTQSFDDAQKPTFINWSIDAKLSTLFPPCGDVRSDLAEVMRPTGIQTRQITINGFGDIIGATPWQSILRGTGSFRPNISSSYYCRVFLKSRDGNAIAVTYVWGQRSDVNRPAHHMEFAAAMTADAFWEMALISISKGIGFGAGDSYEYHLARYVPDSIREKMTNQRLALAFIALTESSSIPMDTVMQRYREIAGQHPDFSDAIGSMLLKSNFSKLGAKARERHFLLAGEIGGAGLISEFAGRLPADGEVKQLMVAVMSRLAERHQLEAPPTANATVRELRDWAARVAKKN